MLWAYKSSVKLLAECRTALVLSIVFILHSRRIRKPVFQVVDRILFLSKRDEIENVEYSSEDDEVVLRFLRENVSPSWHSLGKCAMKPLEKGGVVDWSLSVYGMEGLKVAGGFLYNRI